MKRYLATCAAAAVVLALGVQAHAAPQSDPAKGDAAKGAAATAGAAAGQVARPPAKPAAKAPEKVGFARVSPTWPKWLTVTLYDRVRAESTRPPATKGAEYDSYTINRFRLTASARLSPWFQATVQTQDARVSGYATSPAPKSVRNTVDLRIASVELGKKSARGVTAVVGRQELTVSDGRLMASPDWGNVSRTYEGVRLVAVVPGFKLEVWGAAPVDVTPASFSRAKYGERVFGAWTTFDRVKPLGYVEVYQLAKSNYAATGETGTKGDQRVYATGVRVGGPIGKTITWDADNVVERGHSAGDAISAWATHEGVSWTVGKSASKPKLGAEYNFASGDTDPKDGTKRTFDQLYVSTHGKWGLADQVGWRNMHHFAVKFEVSPSKKLKVNAGINKLYLATLNDAWYGVSGSKVVTNRKATSRDLGWEPDLFATYTVNRDITLGAGLAVLVGGDFVKQSTDVKRIWTPYAMCIYKF